MNLGHHVRRSLLTRLAIHPVITVLLWLLDRSIASWPLPTPPGPRFSRGIECVDTPRSGTGHQAPDTVDSCHLSGSGGGGVL